MHRRTHLQPFARIKALGALIITLMASTKVYSSALSSQPLRLTVSGSQLLDPITGEDVRLTGFNWVLSHLHEGDGTYMQSLMPGANAARIVAVLWDDSTSSSDCMTNEVCLSNMNCGPDTTL